MQKYCVLFGVHGTRTAAESISPGRYSLVGVVFRTIFEVTF